MAYGTLLTDAVQSSTANTPPQFNDGNGTQVGTLCRAWVNFNGTLTGTNPPRASFNVSSVTRTGAGDYTVNFTNAMPDANYIFVAPTLGSASGAYNWGAMDVDSSGNLIGKTTSGHRINVRNSSTNGSQDPTNAYLAYFR